MRYNTHYLEQHGFAQPKVRHGKICHLYGESDPEVFLLGDKPYARSSIKHHFVSSHDSMNTLFFTDSTFPQLHVKQSYVVAKQLVKTPKMTHTEKKLLVRDFYSPAISPVKSSDDAQFTYKNKTTYSEPTLILNAFSKMEDFSRAYNSVQFPQLELSRKIKELSDQTYRYHLLELGADTPSNE